MKPSETSSPSKRLKYVRKRQKQNAPATHKQIVEHALYLRKKDQKHAKYMADRERRLAYAKAQRIKNRAQDLAWREAHRPQLRKYNRTYRISNLERDAASSALRRARAHGAEGSHTTREWLEKCALFGHLCAYCGEANPLEREHNIPLTRGGSHFISNILPACRGCNSRKYNRTAAEFLAA